MNDRISRRGFMRGTAAAVLAVSASALLSACGADAPLTASATGIDAVAEVRGVRMTVRELSWVYQEDGTLLLMPKVRLYNGASRDIPVDPVGGNFLLRVNGSTNLKLNSDTMALLKKKKEWTAAKKQTLGQKLYYDGYLCGTAENVPKFDSVQVFFYPDPKDTKSYLCCRVNANDEKATPLTEF